MNAGYVRLSRDDDKRNYTSIENQKLIITQYASERNIVIDRWYEDDGISGYIFDRPGFNQLMKDLNRDIDTVFVKDFSRLGRHNAKILLLLDEFQEQGKRLIIIDDHYDSEISQDDTIGITTWFNERYVKDTSRKIRRAIGARQREGTLMTQPPFGYKRTGKDRKKLEIIPEEAEYIRAIYDLYIQGNGYRKISTLLAQQGVPTPSMARRERELREGKDTGRRIAVEWTDGMVKDILGNDFYTGAFRLRKRARSAIHGKDRRIPKDEQYIFENHHPPVIDKMTFELVRELREKRAKSGYRGSHGQRAGSEAPSPFGSCLYCRDCGRKLTPARRQTSAGVRKYYICSTYNAKGRLHCPKAHLIEEKELMEDVVNYLCMCRNTYCETIAAYDMKAFTSENKSITEKSADIRQEIIEKKRLLQTLFTQKIKDIANAPGNEALIRESYNSIQKDLTERIHFLENRQIQLRQTKSEIPDEKEKLHTALEVVDDIIRKGNLNRGDVEILIERIEVDENGRPEIRLKHKFPEPAHFGAEKELNRRENEIILAVMELIRRDSRGYTSARYLSGHLTAMGYPRSGKSVLPYIEMMIEMGILSPGDNKQKPYAVIKNKEEIGKLMTSFGSAQSYRQLPENKTLFT